MLLSCKTAEELQLVKFAFSVHQISLENLLKQYPTLFDGIGCLKDKEIQLHINKSVQPIALRHRRIAFHLRPKVEEELKKLEEAGIIEKVEGPTPWVSPIVVTRKPKQPGEVRLCVDMRLPNTAIKRERHGEYTILWFRESLSVRYALVLPVAVHPRQSVYPPQVQYKSTAHTTLSIQQQHTD